MLSNVLFDLDGTLTDPKDGITRCIRFCLDQLGVTAPQADDLTWCIGPPLRGSLSQLLDTTEDIVIDQALAHYRQRFARTGMFENVVYPEVAASLGRIRELGLRIFLATSKPRVYAEQILDHFDLTPFFHGIYGSELNGALSNKGELVAHILDTEKLDRRTTLMVGDRAHDIDGGRQNGVMTAAVSYGYGTHEEIRASKPHVVFHTISDLAIFLESQAAKKEGL